MRAVHTLRTTAVATAAWLLCSCAPSTDYVASSKYPATRPESVEILCEEPRRPYQVIAFVEAKTVTIFDKPEQIRRKAVEHAAAVGADAVIFTTSGKYHTFGIPGVAAGRAIKWKNSAR